jgi:DHA1 family bicyclomycin/chloramphenicol resistance-like MFS transporter
MKLRPDTFAMTAALAMLTALGPLSTDFYLPSLPDIARALRTDTAGAQATLSVFLFGFAAGQIFWGPLSDRLGRRPVLLLGLGLFTLATLACAFAGSIETLIGARFLQALGASGPIVLGRAMARDLYEGPRAGKELARMGMIMGLVPAIAPVLGGVLQDAYGWRSTFFASLVFALALVAMVGLILPETLRERLKEPFSLTAILRGYRRLIGHARFRIYAGLTSLAYAGLFAFISGSSFVLIDVYRLSPIAYGLSFSFGVIGYISGTILAQRLVSRRGLDGVIGLGVMCLAGGGALMLAAMLLIGQRPGLLPSLAVTLPMALYTMGVGLTMPQAQASAMMPFPERAGAASSLVGICQMTLSALVGLGVGHLLSGTGPAGGGPVPSALPLPAAILCMGALALILFRFSAPVRAARA